jgi:hypothetical protein
MKKKNVTGKIRILIIDGHYLPKHKAWLSSLNRPPCVPPERGDNTQSFKEIVTNEDVFSPPLGGETAKRRGG